MIFFQLGSIFTGEKFSMIQNAQYVGGRMKRQSKYYGSAPRLWPSRVKGIGYSKRVPMMGETCYR
jgi:hypothetical protein